MKVFVSLFFLASLVFAEPPVGDGYLGAQSSHDHHHNHEPNDHHSHHISDHQKSSSQEYGPPSLTSARNAPSNGYDYNAPNARSFLDARGQSRLPSATVRVSFNQRYSSAVSRNSNNAAARKHPQEHPAPNTRSGVSQEYGAPAARSPSQEYGAPTSSSLSQEYGEPSATAGRTLSSEYGVPKARSSPSEKYGAPAAAARRNQKPASSFNFRGLSAKSLPQDYNAPAARSQGADQFHDYSASSARSNEIPQNHDAPKSALLSRKAPSSTYDAPSLSLANSYSALSTRNSNTQGYDSVSQTYDAPNQEELTETYGAPNAKSLSQDYGVPSSRSNQKTEAIASSYSSARSSPSLTYLPAVRETMPSQQYGVPEQGSQGYENARARALNELLNQEPANYDFGYQIEDQESGSEFGHTETREENRAVGSYFVVLPDGTKQTVEYEADERGFKPVISVEPAAAASARAAGYDQNAQDGTASDQRPY